LSPGHQPPITQVISDEETAMIVTHPVDTAIPELKQGYDEVVAFADFCYFLTDGSARREALALAETARELLETVRSRLVTDD
jgi:hypothetical protein